MKESIYTGRLRVRASGLLVKDEKILLVKLRSPISNDDIWTPPGGGVEFGESIHEALKREFKEETGLYVEVGKLIHINELLEVPFHAMEFYFWVEEVDGKLELGKDPEHDAESQLLKELEFVSYHELRKRKVKPDFLEMSFLKIKNLSTNFKDVQE